MEDNKIADKEDKRVKYTKILFLTLVITILIYFLTSIDLILFIGLVIIQFIAIIIVQVVYYQDLPHDYDEPDKNRNRRQGF